MSGNRDLVNELVDLYEKNVNERKRKEILDGMLAHPCGHTLAELIFRRAHSSVFISARNQFLSTINSDQTLSFRCFQNAFWQFLSFGRIRATEPENGEYMYDSILAPAHCKSILRSLGSDDYVVNFLRDEFNHKFGRDPCSLSDIAQIMDERHQIQNETAIPRFEVSMPIESSRSKIKIGCEWIVHYRMETYSVYKICRSLANGIWLEKMSRSSSAGTSGFYFLEPFLIMKTRKGFKVLNLLEPNAAPIAIEREGLIKMSGWQSYQYESDKRENGKLPESVLFLLVHQTNRKEICVECIKIRASSIETVWTKIIDKTYYKTYGFNVPGTTNAIFINQDNYVIETYFWISGDLEKKIHHVVLSKAKMNEYILEEEFYKFPARYGIFEETLVQIGVYQQGRILKKVFGQFNSEGLRSFSFSSVCFLKNIDEHGICFSNQDILIKDRDSKLNKNVKRISIRKLIDFINDEDEEKIFVPEEASLITLNAPIICLCEFAEQHGVQEEEVLDRSKIGRVLMKKKKIQIFI